MADDFNRKLGLWMIDVKCIFDDKQIQEEIFDLLVNASEIGDNEREIGLIKTISSILLKLSFIIKNDSKKTNTLIAYLKQD